MEPLITDPRHGLPLPSGLALARVVGRLLRRQRQALDLRRVAPAPVDPAAVEMLVPVFARYFQQGASNAARRVLPAAAAKAHGRQYLGRPVDAVRPLVVQSREDDPRGEERDGSGRRTPALSRLASRRIGVAPRRRKNILTGLLTLGAGAFDVFNPATLEAVRRAVFDFLAAFNQATADQLREALAESLAKGETGRDLQRRLQPVFGPQRAFTVGVTESSRAVHAGQLLAARAEGVVTGRTWLASADACDACLSLDGKTVGLGEPFAVGVGKNPAYSTVWHPPYHPHCMCAVVDEID